MKLRTGFVTNSSSTSYCVVGTYDCPINSKKLAAVWSEKTGKPMTEEEASELDSWSKTDMLNDLGLTAYSGEMCDGFVGLSISRIKDDETFGEFKQRALSLIQTISDGVTSVGLIQESFYNG